jgi:hypothetical protein
MMLRFEGVPTIEYIRFFLGPFIFILFPLTIYFWKRLSKLNRLFAAISNLSVVITYIAMGTNKAIADMVLLTPWLLWAGHLSGVSKLNWRNKTFLMIAGGVVLILFFAFFTVTQSTRYGSAAVYGYMEAISSPADYQNIFVRRLPPKLQIAVLGLTSGITQGYYALSLCLEEPFVPMYGVGNSMFLFRQAAKISGNPEIMDMPYPARIEKYGWNAYSLWSTIYPWIASDVSFPGTIVLVFIIGRLFALTWLDAIKGSNPFAIVMFAQFLIMLYYFSANNQCVQSGEGFSSFWSLLLLWLFYRGKSRPILHNSF